MLLVNGDGRRGGEVAFSGIGLGVEFGALDFGLVAMLTLDFLTTANPRGEGSLGS